MIVYRKEEVVQIKYIYIYSKRSLPLLEYEQQPMEICAEL